MSDSTLAAPLLLTARDTARALAVCPKTLWTLTRSGRLPCVHVTDRAIRYDAADVRAFIENSKAAPVRATP